MAIDDPEHDELEDNPRPTDLSEPEIDQLEADSDMEVNLSGRLDPSTATGYLTKGLYNPTTMRWFNGPQLKKNQQKKKKKVTNVKTKAKAAVPKAKAKEKAKEEGKGKENQGKSAGEKRKSEDTDGDGHDDTVTILSSDGDDTPAKPRTKRACTTVTAKPSPKFIAYILLEQPPSAVPARASKFTKASAVPEHSKHKPIMFSTDTPFPDFVAMLSASLNCEVNDVHLDTATWDYESAAKAKSKPLADVVSYDAMVTQVSNSAKNKQVINVRLPIPKRSPITKPRDVNSAQSEYAYEDILANPAAISVHEQIALSTQGDTFNGCMQRLDDHHRKDNYAALFPKKRMYKRDGRFWELTQCRLVAWAIAWSKGEAGVDIDNAPNSIHFDHSAAMRVPHGAPAGHAPGGTVDDGPTPASALAVAPASGPGPSAQGPVVDTFTQFMQMQLMQMQLMQSQYTMPGFRNAHTPGFMAHPASFLAQSPSPLVQPPGLLPPPHAATQFPSPHELAALTQVSPFAATHPPSVPISIAEFCAKYDIPADDGARLEALGAIPGDPRMEELVTEEMWKKAGFAPYGWARMLHANKYHISQGSSAL
ncbi:hypothetical protein K466DRAFT_662405 [Polyporus arcularius HHB13444]|uniref:Uncharacterized protein n=1 Tax=Polyporus arcularius HHB13444 TaxID=1314778 RepID=A0A5C3PGC1_9APHY|nr:hypothetical protein K466DRAFT_662405 [Polyporus arcularius HHB13444]